MSPTAVRTAPPSHPQADLEEVPDSTLGAFLYEPFLWFGERLGMASRRRRLLERAEGRVLEIGAGTGLNLSWYPSSVEELVLAEPAHHMAARIDADRAPAGVPVSVVDARAEELPFADDRFDTVVSTMVLCTVQDQERALAEIGRVLRPGGRLLFCEHVRAEGGWRRRLQDTLAGPWAAYADGCRCNRETVAGIAGRFELGAVERDSWRGMPVLVTPLAIGEAVA